MTVAVAGDQGRLFAGEVVAHEWVHAADGASELRVRAYDALHRLRKRQRVVARTDVNVAELADELAGEAGLSVKAEASGPAWPLLVQHRQNDLELLAELAEQAGLWFVVVDGDLHLFTLEGFDDPVDLALHDTLLTARFDATADPACRTVQTRGWDPVSATALAGDAGSARVGRDVGADVGPGTVERRRRAPPRRPPRPHGRPPRRRGAGGARPPGRSGGHPHGHRGGRRAAASRAAHTGRPGPTPTSPAPTSSPRPSTPSTPPATSSSCRPARRHRRPGPQARRRPSAWCSAPTILTASVGCGSRSPATATWRPTGGRWSCQARAPARASSRSPTWTIGSCVLLPDGDPAAAIVVGGLYGDARPADPGLEGGKVRRWSVLTPGGQRVVLDDELGKTVIANRDGSSVVLAPDRVTVHAAADLVLQAPGKTMTLRANRIELLQAITSEEAPG